MKLRTAAYLAIAITFARAIFRKILRPSREDSGLKFSTDQLIVATPKYARGTVVVIATIAAGAPWVDTVKCVKVVARHLDLCEVRLIERSDLGDFSMGRETGCYSNVPESIMSSRPNELVDDVINDHIPDTSRIFKYLSIA